MVKTDDIHDTAPPRLDTYDKEGDLVYVSQFNNGDELVENIRMATFLANHTQENVFVLPLIQPTLKDATKLRNELFPNGVKKNKNPDYYFRKRFLDAKCMNESVPSTKKLTKRNIQNRLKEAFAQADDAFLEIPVTYPLSWVKDAVKGKLKSSSNQHIVYVRYGDSLLTFE